MRSPSAAACWLDSRGLPPPPSPPLPSPSQDYREACLAFWNNGTKRPPRGCRNLFDRDCCCNESSSRNYFHLLPAQTPLGPKLCLAPKEPKLGLVTGKLEEMRRGVGGGGGAHSIFPWSGGGGGGGVGGLPGLLRAGKGKGFSVKVPESGTSQSLLSGH